MSFKLKTLDALGLENSLNNSNDELDSMLEYAIFLNKINSNCRDLADTAKTVLSSDINEHAKSSMIRDHIQKVIKLLDEIDIKTMKLIEVADLTHNDKKLKDTLQEALEAKDLLRRIEMNYRKIANRVKSRDVNGYLSQIENLLFRLRKIS